jgi:hypothetical protein
LKEGEGDVEHGTVTVTPRCASPLTCRGCGQGSLATRTGRWGKRRSAYAYIVLSRHHCLTALSISASNRDIGFSLDGMSRFRWALNTSEGRRTGVHLVRDELPQVTRIYADLNSVGVIRKSQLTRVEGAPQFISA